MTNRLAQQSSPYLLQHANNPVDWHPWDDEALSRARADDRPIFLSIGYAACHWCHVMEHESFENAGIANYLNQHFINIKVDREERPDLDQVYMVAVQLLTGRGGWPMSVFLTPDLEPFFGGTYWPPVARMGMPGFQQVLAAVVDAWQQRRDQAVTQAQQLAEQIRQVGAVQTTATAHITLPEWLQVESALAQVFDPVQGGFGGAPKFPHPMELQVLLRAHHRTGSTEALEMVERTLDCIAAGGIYDHLGGGFARYSVDDKWLVPHFEKMLYDNALLTSAYLEAFQVTRNRAYATVAQETIDYVLRDLRDERGGFHSTEDADSEGEEGRFYVWSSSEVEQLLGPELAERFGRIYDVTPGGNFEGSNILHRTHSISWWADQLNCDLATLEQELQLARATLFRQRCRRVRPGKDDKVLASWNGLFLEALARGAVVLESNAYRQAAIDAGEFLRSEMRGSDGRLWHTWRNGRASINGFLDDYACVGNGMVAMYEATFDESWLEFASDLAESTIKHFRDPDGGGFFFTPDDHEKLIARQKDYHDSSVPSSNGALAMFLIRLGTLCGNSRWLEMADQILLGGAAIMQRSPMAAGQLYLAADWSIGPRYELLLCTPSPPQPSEPLVRAWGQRLLPRSVRACRDRQAMHRPGPLHKAFQGKSGAGSEPHLYICQDHACSQPVVGEAAILSALNSL